MKKKIKAAKGPIFIFISINPSVWLKKPIGRFRIEEERETSLSANRDCFFFLAQERAEKEKAREIEKDRKSRRQRRASVQIEIVH